MTDDVPGSTPAEGGAAGGPQQWAVPQSWVIPPDWALPDVHNPGAQVEPESAQRESAQPGYDTGSDAWLRAQPAAEPAAESPAESPAAVEPAATEPAAPEPGAVTALAVAPDPIQVALVSRSDRRRLLAAELPPGRSPVRAILGAAVAVAGVAVLLAALLAMRSGPGADSPTVVSAVGDQAAAAPDQLLAVRVPSPAVSAPPQAAPASAGLTPLTARSARPANNPVPPAEAVAARGQLTVLNDSRIKGLADRAAAEFRAGGWSVPTVGNYTGQVPATTVYYGPDQEPAARQLVAQFTGIVRVLPRFAGLPGSGLTVVVTREYPA